jgi:polyisoprenoid-binding protein YceI
MTSTNDGVWQLDPERSSVESHVRHFYGLMTVKRRFDRYDGTLQLNGRPAVELVIDADSLDTKEDRS